MCIMLDGLVDLVNKEVILTLIEVWGWDGEVG